MYFPKLFLINTQEQVLWIFVVLNVGLFCFTKLFFFLILPFKTFLKRNLGSTNSFNKTRPLTKVKWSVLWISCIGISDPS